ncbi:MAG: family 16 glycosylhydrolase [Phycisphaerales bacterium JB059]
MSAHKHGFAMTLGVLGLATMPALAQYELVWADEFDGTTIADHWEHQIGTGTAYGLPAGWGNEELQYYTDQIFNSFVNDGALSIVAQNIPFGGRPYSSARLRTLGSFEVRYGRVEARIKLPKGQGLWPAFWMLPTDSPYGGWASSGEIDVMESVNQMNRIHGTLHFGAPWPQNTSAGGTLQDGTDFSQDFHVYSVEWTPDAFTWSVDGQAYRTVTSNQWYSSAATGNGRAPFDTSFHLLLNVAVGGLFPGDPDGSASFPQQMQVDWVRVYRLEQGPFGGAPHGVPGRIEAEDFDVGYPDEAYQDCDFGNNGESYRLDTDVDIQPASEGGFNLGWVCDDEWLEYTVSVASAGEYGLRARVASPGAGGSLRFSVEGSPIAPDLSFGSTGDWQNWTTVETQATLEAGEQVIRMTAQGASFNVNWFELEAISVGCSPADLAEPFGSQDFSDVIAFLGAFAAGEPLADLAAPLGVLDFSDVLAFLSAFSSGCP